MFITFSQSLTLFSYRDIRSVHGDAERIESFDGRAEKYFQKFISSASSSALSSLPYLHLLRQHTGELMKVHFDLFGWGYGMYCCNAGEHLNKVIKSSESSGTNYDKSRFFSVVRLLRSKQFEFTGCILPSDKSQITCSACNQQGHNRKNKSCPMHPSHPVILFEESENED